MKDNSTTPKGKSQAISIAATPQATRNNGTGHASVALMKNIAAPKDSSFLYDEEDIEERERRIIQEFNNYGIDRRGKPFSLSSHDTRLSLILGSFLNTNDPDVEAFILWTERAEKLGLSAVESPPTPIARNFSLKELAKVMYNGRCEKDKIAQIRGALKRISETKQVMVLGANEIKITSSLISIDFSIEDLTSQDRGIDHARIVFGTIFLWNLKRRFGYISPKAWEIWGRRGSGTENDLFPVLFCLLHSICYFRQQRAQGERVKLKKLFSKCDYSSEQKEKIRIEHITEALTYAENVDTFKRRLDTDYSSSKQLRYNFTQDFKAAVKALKEIGIITSGTIQKGRGKRGQDMVVFVFNENYKDPKEIAESYSD